MVNQDDIRAILDEAVYENRRWIINAAMQDKAALDTINLEKSGYPQTADLKRKELIAYLRSVGREGADERLFLSGLMLSGRCLNISQDLVSRIHSLSNGRIKLYLLQTEGKPGVFASPFNSASIGHEFIFAEFKEGRISARFILDTSLRQFFTPEIDRKYRVGQIMKEEEKGSNLRVRKLLLRDGYIAIDDVKNSKALLAYANAFRNGQERLTEISEGEMYAFRYPPRKIGSEASSASFDKIKGQVFSLSRGLQTRESQQLNLLYKLIVWFVSQRSDSAYAYFRYPYETARVGRYVCPEQNWQRLTNLLESVEPKDLDENNPSVALAHLIVSPERNGNSYDLIFNEQIFEHPLRLFSVLVHELAGHINWIEREGLNKMVNPVHEEAASAQAEEFFIEYALENKEIYLGKLRSTGTVIEEDLAYLDKALDLVELQKELMRARTRVEIYTARIENSESKGSSSVSAQGRLPELERVVNQNIIGGCPISREVGEAIDIANRRLTVKYWSENNNKDREFVIVEIRNLSGVVDSYILFHGVAYWFDKGLQAKIIFGGRNAREGKRAKEFILTIKAPKEVDIRRAEIAPATELEMVEPRLSGQRKWNLLSRETGRSICIGDSPDLTLTVIKWNWNNGGKKENIIIELENAGKFRKHYILFRDKHYWLDKATNVAIFFGGEWRRYDKPQTAMAEVKIGIAAPISVPVWKKEKAKPVVRSSSAAAQSKRKRNRNTSLLILSEQDLKVKRQVMHSDWSGEKKAVIRSIKFNDSRTPFKLAKFNYGTSGDLAVLELVRVREKGKLAVRRSFQFQVPVAKGVTMHFVYRKADARSRKKLPYIVISEAGNGSQLLRYYQFREKIVDRPSGRAKIKRMQISLFEYNDDYNKAILQAYSSNGDDVDSDNFSLSGSLASASSSSSPEFYVKPEFAVIVHPALNDSISLDAYKNALEGTRFVAHIGHPSNLFYTEIPRKIRESGAQFINPSMSRTGAFRPPFDFRKRVLFAGGDVKSSLLTAIQHVARQAFEEGDREIVAEINTAAAYGSKPDVGPYSLENLLQSVEQGVNLHGFFDASGLKPGNRIPQFLIHLFSSYPDRDFERTFLPKYKVIVTIEDKFITLNPAADSNHTLVIKIIRTVSPAIKLRKTSSSAVIKHIAGQSAVFIPKRLGILTGGGPASGHNQVIYAAYKRAKVFGIDLIAISNGWQGLYSESLVKKAHKLILREIEPYHADGGTVLGTSRFNPFEAKNVAAGVPEKIWENILRLKLDGLITLGGDDTNGVTSKLSV
ncbi:MAG: 6-phosphofructokinase, partial [Candidatus Omnitrophota bacterium]